MDEMKLYGIFPLSFALGIFITTVLFRTRDLGMPLWMGRNFMKWSGTSLFIILFVGYLQLQRGFQQDNQRKLFTDYQSKLDVEK